MVETQPPPDQASLSPLRTTAPAPVADATPHQACNLHAELTATLDTIAAELTRFHVRVELAVSPDLTIKTSSDALRTIIRSVVTHATTTASGKRMLIVALRRPAGVALVFTYEDGGQDPLVQDSALRPAQQQAALLGASLVVDVRSGIATTVTLMLRDPSA